MKTRSLAAATIGAIASISLAACSSVPSDGAPSGNGASDGTTIVLSFWASDTADQAVWQNVADMVQDAHPDLTVELQTIGWNDYWTKLPTTLAGANAPCLIGMSAPRVQQFGGLLAPLDDYMAEHGIEASDFESSVLEVMQANGEQVAVPYDFGPYVMYYNRDMFEAAGVPEPEIGWTVDEFVQAAKELTDGTRYGFALNNAIDAMNIWGPTIGGVQSVSPSGELGLTAPGLEKTLSWYAGLQTTEGIAAPLAADSWDGGSFIAGNAAMYASGPWDMVSAKSTVDFDAGVVTMPVGDAGPATVVSGSGFAISQQCADKDDAARALAVMTGPEALEYLATEGRAFPARPAQQASWFSNAVEGAQPVLQAAQEVGQPYRSTDQWNQISVEWTDGVTSVINGDASAESFLTSLQSTYGS